MIPTLQPYYTAGTMQSEPTLQILERRYHKNMDWLKAMSLGQSILDMFRKWAEHGQAVFLLI